MKLSFIRIPLYKLHYVNTIDEIEFNEKFAENFRAEYNLDKRKQINIQLEWCLQNPDFDFVGLSSTKERFSNKEIYSYLVKLSDFYTTYQLSDF